MKKVMIILAIVLIASVTNLQAQNDFGKTTPNMYTWAGQFSISGTHLPEDEFGYWVQITGQYKQIKKDACICENDPFTVMPIAGFGIPISDFHLKLGAGMQLAKNTNTHVAMIAIEHPSFEIGTIAIIDPQKITYEFTGLYYPFAYGGIGGGWNTTYSIPIIKVTLRFPTTFKKGGCGGCSFDR